jgi:glycosyltransferase involved in cell wall biosynthesis
LRSLGVALKSFRIARLVQRDAIPIVHTAWSHYPSVTGLLIKKLLPEVRLTMALGAHDRSFHHPMTARAAARAEVLVTQGRTLREMIIREFPEMSVPIRIIMRGVDADRTEKHAGQDHTPGLIASVGRLDADKGHQYLIRALATVRTTTPHARLDIYGMGPYEEELVSLARSLGVSDSVRFIGHVAQDVMFAGLARAQVFALATLVDNLPNSVKEACALGLPVVTTPTNGIDELVIDGKTGFIVEADDVADWAAKLEYLLGDDASARRMGAAGQGHIRAVASLARTTDARFTLYSLIAQQARK